MYFHVLHFLNHLKCIDIFPHKSWPMIIINQLVEKKKGKKDQVNDGIPMGATIAIEMSPSRVCPLSWGTDSNRSYPSIDLRRKNRQLVL